MDQKLIFNQIELAYSPLSNFEFTILKEDEIILSAIEASNVYVIGQRAILSFENIEIVSDEQILYFEIHQKDNPNVLKCRLPYLQDIIGANEERLIGMAINTIDSLDEHETSRIKKIHGFSLVEYPDNCVETVRFLVWFSPEKFLQNYWKGLIECEVDGDIRNFLIYKVHYVGKATEQTIVERLTGHSSLQDILSLENPFKFGDLPTHEIVILFLKFRDNLEMHTWGENTDPKEMAAVMMGKKRPNEKKIFLDAEKALVKAMKPKYNKILFKNYPKSNDGLYNEKYNTIVYTFMEPITFKYDNGEIQGGLSIWGGDSIIIKENKDFILKRHNKQDVHIIN